MSRRQKRQRFMNWLRNCLSFTGTTSIQKPSHVQRSVRVESLERRELMAADIAPWLGSSQNEQSLVGSSVAGLKAEGEAAPDLVAFAKALDQSGTTMYGAYWCPHCLAQKRLFEDGAQFLPYVEMTDANRNPTTQATTLGITDYPTWEFPDGTRFVGEMTLAQLSTRSGVAIPQSIKPSFATIPDTTVERGSPYHVPVDAYDPNGNPLTVTVSSSNPNVVSAEVLQGNKSMRIRVKDFGDMVFQLFSTEVNIPTDRIIQLAQQGFYNNIIFHRVANNFVIQAGDPLGTGAGGSQLGDIDDQFNVNLQHNRTGVLSYAKTSEDDTGDSQFFITEGQSRHLDFNHAVFGQLIEGEKVRDAISNVAVNPTTKKPTVNIVIESVTIFDDNENALIRLKSNANSGDANITVTVTDTEGQSTSQTFKATAIADQFNGAPFLNAIPTVNTPVNTPVTVNLTSQDAENNPVVYSVSKVSSGNYELTPNPTTGAVVVTPGAGFTGQIKFLATVQQVSSIPTNTDSTTDTQLVTVNVVAGAAPTAVALDTASDSGSSNSDRITNATAPTFTVSGTTAGAIVKLKVGSNVIGQATATGTTTVVTANDIGTVGQGSILVVATQTVSGAESSPSPSTSVTYDTTGPATINPALIPSSAEFGKAMSVNLAHVEEGQGLVYTLQNAPAGMTIDPDTGVISWTPTQAQLGTQTFSLKLTDKAGNTTTQALAINVIDKALAKIILEAVDMQGNPITQIATGQQFKIRFLTQDVRGLIASGVFSSYIDMLYDSTVVEPVASDAIAYADPFVNGKSPTNLTPVVPNQINELGAIGGLTRTDGQPKLIATVTFLAKAAGNPNIRSEPADLTGNDILIFDNVDKLASSQVDYGAANLVVGANFQVNPDAFNVDEDAAVQSINVLANDTVTGNTVLTITAVGAPSASGTVTIAPDGKSVNYKPGLNFNGAETFTYTVKNQDNVSLTTTVTVQVAEKNDPPVANNDAFDVTTNSTNNVLNVLLNDTTGVDGSSLETLRVTAVGPTGNGGTVTIGSSGLNVQYTPRAGFTGTDTFTYTLGDGRGGTVNATVSVNVKVANPPPVAVTDTFPVVEDADEAQFDVIANDTTDPGETLTISAVSGSSRGSVFRISSDSKKVFYKPGPNFNGAEVLTYTLKDSGGATTTGTVTFNVSAVNDAPDAVNDAENVLAPSGAKTINVLANDINVDQNETLTITAVSSLASGQGTVAISSDKKSLIYTPPSATFTGTVTFTYTLSDSQLTDTATVTLTVQNYTPITIGGALLDSASGVNANFLTIGGVDYVLSGTDINGQAVSSQISTARDGTFQQTNVVPGNYTLSRPALPFLNDTGTSIAISTTVADTTAKTVNTPVGGLRAKYISILDFLGSAAVNNLTMAVKAGGSESWYTVRNGLTGYNNIRGQLNAAGTTLTLNATNPSNQNVRATLPMTDAKVMVLASEGDHRLIRVTGAPESLGFTVVSGTTGSGEGEGSAAARRSTSTSAFSSLGGLKAEGEATPEITSPNATLSPSQALRSLLGSSTQANNGSTSTLVNATSHLLPGAVDSALSEIDTLTLGNSEVDEITNDELGTNVVDEVFQAI